MPHRHRQPETGPFRADQLREGDRYELANGHPLYCTPAGRDHAAPHLTGAAVIDSDPDVAWAGVDAGFSPDPATLHAPDIAVTAPPTDPETGGWIPGAPPLAVEYAGRGQDEAELHAKIAKLLAAGTRFVWVVRLRGPRRVEVHEAGQPVRRLGVGDVLEAPGILRNPVPVEALYDRAAGHRVTLRNLLQREGYDSLDAVRAEGVLEGRAEGVLEGRAEGVLEGRAEGVLEGRAEGVLEGRAEGVLEGERAGRIADLRRLLARRFGPLPTWALERLAAGTPAQLESWLDGILDAPSLEALLGAPPAPDAAPADR